MTQTTETVSYYSLTDEQLRMLVMANLQGLPTIHETGPALVVAFHHQGRRYHFTGASERDIWIPLLEQLAAELNTATP
jgi:hypothetical protein